MEQFQTIIFFVRHGDTDKIYSPDPAIDNQRVLTERGRAQLKKVGTYLQAFQPTTIYCSPRLRTVQSAEIIGEFIGRNIEIVEDQSLYEIYGDQAYRALKTSMPDFVGKLVKKHAGEQVVCVSHMDTIQGALESLGVSETEADFPCRTAEGYRVVFAGNTMVECQKIRPANEV